MWPEAAHDPRGPRELLARPQVLLGSLAVSEAMFGGRGLHRMRKKNMDVPGML